MKTLSVLDFALCLALLYANNASNKKIKEFCRSVKMEDRSKQNLVRIVLHSDNKKLFLKEFLKALL